MSDQTERNAAGGSIQPAQQLQSSTQLQSDLDGVKPDKAPLERDLLDAVTQLEQDYQKVAGSHARSGDAHLQQALNSVKQAIADLRPLADANASTPDAPNPLQQSVSGASSKPASISVQEILNEIKDAFDLLMNVINHLAYTIIVNNPGPGTVTTAHGLSFPRIHCGQAQTICKAYVLALSSVQLLFKIDKPGTVGKIESSPQSACNPRYSDGKSQAFCTVNGTAGNTITITPQWG